MLANVLATTPGTSVPNPTYDLRIPNLPYLYGGFPPRSIGMIYSAKDLALSCFMKASLQKNTSLLSKLASVKSDAFLVRLRIMSVARLPGWIKALRFLQRYKI